MSVTDPDFHDFDMDRTKRAFLENQDTVVVLEDFEEEKGILVTPLVKVGDFTFVFQQHGDVSEAWMIPREEIFWLSHKVSYYLLTYEEGSNFPKGCVVLDPASLPLELLKVEEKVKSSRGRND
ncbi:hypothetical protein L2E82_08984 [Cichorium intybus]|uniref:Uncharacterized protein n=1 Tax=Cichorium intybus TaxID=13427 RepID=A0ACB9G7B0_CICIN|nr:hypothetical protein L2E82_08984 [Cichorium intybus]